MKSATIRTTRIASTAASARSAATASSRAASNATTATNDGGYGECGPSCGIRPALRRRRRQRRRGLRRRRRQQHRRLRPVRAGLRLRPLLRRRHASRAPTKSATTTTTGTATAAAPPAKTRSRSRARSSGFAAERTWSLSPPTASATGATQRHLASRARGARGSCCSRPRFGRRIGALVRGSCRLHGSTVSVSS